MNFSDQQVAAKWTAFETAHDPTLVLQALELIEAAERDPAAGGPAQRKQALERRLRFFAALDRSIDPAWEAQKLPVKGVAPPPSHRGIVYGSGEVDPAAIADPAERAEYVRALQASKDYARSYDVQFQLRRIDEQATQSFERLLAERYATPGGDRAEFEALLAASPVSEARKQRLRALLPTG